MKKHFATTAIVAAALSVGTFAMAQQSYDPNAQSQQNDQSPAQNRADLSNQSQQLNQSSSDLNNAQTAGSQQPGSEQGTWRDLQVQQGQSAQSGQSGYSNYGTAGTSYQAQQASSQQQGQSNQMEQLFLKGLSEDNQFEIQLAQVALNKTQNQQVKDIAQRIITDHQSAQQKVQQVAQQMGVSVPTQLSQEKQDKLAAFQQLQGQQFDQHFLSVLKADHMRDASELADVSQIAQDQQVRQLAQQLLPTIRHHEHMIAQAAQAEGLPGPRQAGFRERNESGSNAQQGAYEQQPSNYSGSSSNSNNSSNGTNSSTSDTVNNNPGDTNNR